MTYAEANTWFKVEHEAQHAAKHQPLSGYVCLTLNCGELWSRIIRLYPTVDPVFRER